MKCDLCQGERFLRYPNGEDRPCELCNEAEAVVYASTRLREDERTVGRRGVAAAREALKIVRDGTFYVCVCGYRNVSLLAVENHRTRGECEQ